MKRLRDGMHAPRFLDVIRFEKFDDNDHHLRAPMRTKFHPLCPMTLHRATYALVGLLQEKAHEEPG